MISRRQSVGGRCLPYGDQNNEIRINRATLTTPALRSTPTTVRHLPHQTPGLTLSTHQANTRSTKNGATAISERHRHRYEVNTGYRDALERAAWCSAA